MLLRYALPVAGLPALLIAALPAGCASGSTAETSSGGSTASTSGTSTRPDGGSGGGAQGGGGGGQCSTEICDGIDNDCDDEVDEGCACTVGDTQSCYTGDDAVRGVGACVEGSQACDGNGLWGSCIGDVLPTEETCNGDDDDCNGTVDDGLGTLSCGQGECQITVEACENGAPQSCVPPNPPHPNELCDGVDDNCNGQVDEGCSCTNGQQQSCYTGSNGTLGVGPCHGGTQTCTNGAWGSCVGQVIPTAEICDTIDQDCDGNSAEGTCSLANAVSTCTNGSCVISSCSAGYSNCDSQASNGCETRHSGYSNSAPGVDLGAWAADAVYGIGCLGGGSCEGLLSVTSTQGGYMFIDALEDSGCCAYIGMLFELVVPPGIDYDLHLTGSGCYADPAWQSLGGTGTDEVIAVWCDDDCGGADNSFYVNIEVRYWSGASCEPWQLNVYRRAC